MLSKAENDLLTKTGPGTVMGEVFRRFWIPALLSSEIAEPDSPPVELKLLGERLVAFRTTDGQSVVMDALCPHRRASLYWGRVEDNCIRCVYHGWQFDAAGQCVDMPAEPENSRFKERIKISSYATHEAAGIVWTYMGPQASVPPFPHFEFAQLPTTHSLSGKRRVPCNYLQNLEGEMDSAHVNFLHNDFASKGGAVMRPSHELRTRYEVAKTGFGLIAAARRDFPGDTTYWRLTPFLLPSFTIIPSVPELKHLTAAVPLDDENMWGFTVSWRPDRPMDAEDRDRFFSGRDQQILVDPKTFLGIHNKDNDYGIDRTRQREESFTGIVGTRLQDCAVQEDQDGPVLPRWKEHLGTTDRAIVAVRRRLIGLARDLSEGIEPAEPRQPEAFLARSTVGDVPAGTPWRTVWNAAQPDGAPLDHIEGDE